MRFAHPELLWLLLVLPPALLAFLAWARRRRYQLLAQFIEARLLPQLTAGISPAREQVRALILTVALACLVVALARPQWGSTWEEARQKGLDIVVAIDTSKSMLAEDIKPNRLARAKLAAIDLMQTAKSDRLGLVAFAGSAFLQCPLTIDDAAFRQSVEMLDVNTLPQGGTALAEAIVTAQSAFKEGDSHRVLVLFTDGEDHDSNAVEAARKAAEAGMRIFTIGIGSAEGELLQERGEKGQLEYIKDDAGNVVKSRLNEPLLQEIAADGNGFYLPLRGATVIDTLYEKGLAPLPKSESEAKMYKRYHEQFHWPLTVAILLLITEILLPSRGRRARLENGFARPAAGHLGKTAILVLLLLPAVAFASPSGALRDYKAGNFGRAQAEYQRLLEKRGDDPRLALNAGTAAFRGGKLGEAESLLSKAVTAPDLQVQEEAYYNRGYTRFQTGEAAEQMDAKKSAWEQSLKDFESAMKLAANDADAKYNYEFVKRKLEQLKQQEQQQKQQDKDQKPDQNQDQKEQKNQQDQQQQQDQKKQDQQKSVEQKNQDQQNSQQQQQSKSDEHQKQDQKKQDQQPQADQKQQDAKKPDQRKPGQPEKPGKKDSGDQKPQQASAGQEQNQMSQDQAMRVLDTTKGDEKMLPVQVERPPQTDRKFKDW